MNLKELWKSYFHLFIGTLVLVVFLYVNNLYWLLQNEIFITVIVTIISLTFTINYNRYVKKKIFHEVFTYFNKRYDQLNENLNRLKEGRVLIFKQNNDLEFQKKLFIYDYLNLCAEEYFWFREGMINVNVWDNWFSGIQYFLQNDDIISVIKSERGEPYSQKSYYGFLHSDYIEEILRNYRG